MSYLNVIVDAINQCPEYIGKGIMQLVIYLHLAVFSWHG